MGKLQSRIPTKDERKATLQHHFKYEVDMLSASYTVLLGPLNWPHGNLAIEAFCVHARNLLEFFWSNHGNGSMHCSSKHFTTCGPLILKNDFKLEEESLNNQIMHLQYGRPIGDGQIDREFRRKLFITIRNLLERFKKELCPEWTDDYPYKDAAWPEITQKAIDSLKQQA